MKKILFTLLAMGAIAHAQPRIIASIYPLQQIANEISGQSTKLLADSYLSPHNYAVKPSDAKAIADADLVIWVGEAMMPQLDKYIDKRPQNKKTITASKLANIQLIRGQHHHDSEKNEEENHETHEHHEKLSYDPHLWLSTHNAEVIATAIADALIQLDTSHTKIYRKNLATFKQKLIQTHHDLIGLFESQPPLPYFVFHDAYAYFEKEFGVEPAAIIRLHAGQTPKTKHLVELKKQLQSQKQACLFSEPQFNSALVKTLIQGTDVKVSTLDPVGYQPNSQAGYTQILRNIAKQLTQCKN